MPYLKVQTNAPVASAEELARKASAFLSEQLGKPESYIMIAVEPVGTMLFAGSPDATVFVEVKSIGLTDARTTELSEALCGFLGAELGVPANRIYIEFAGVPRAMWGWDNRTFA
jgi:phenylpyruvate tautomerase PptA (4-oxalocrotonate tautomerase family)